MSNSGRPVSRAVLDFKYKDNLHSYGPSERKYYRNPLVDNNFERTIINKTFLPDAYPNIEKDTLFNIPDHANHQYIEPEDRRRAGLSNELEGGSYPPVENPDLSTATKRMMYLNVYPDGTPKTYAGSNVPPDQVRLIEELNELKYVRLDLQRQLDEADEKDKPFFREAINKVDEQEEKIMERINPNYRLEKGIANLAEIIKGFGGAFKPPEEEEEEEPVISTPKVLIAKPKEKYNNLLALIGGYADLADVKYEDIKNIAESYKELIEQEEAKGGDPTPIYSDGYDALLDKMKEIEGESDSDKLLNEIERTYAENNFLETPNAKNIKSLIDNYKNVSDWENLYSIDNAKFQKLSGQIFKFNPSGPKNVLAADVWKTKVILKIISREKGKFDEDIFDLLWNSSTNKLKQKNGKDYADNNKANFQKVFDRVYPSGTPKSTPKKKKNVTRKSTA